MSMTALEFLKSKGVNLPSDSTSEQQARAVARSLFKDEWTKEMPQIELEFGPYTPKKGSAGVGTYLKGTVGNSPLFIRLNDGEKLTKDGLERTINVCNAIGDLVDSARVA